MTRARPRRARALMFQGTGSDVGKSVLVAGLARAYTRRGLKVLPFKPQNMSNNAAVTIDGGEIGRAQALQAFACRAAPEVDMNPVLLKPTHETGAQIIVQGQIFAQMSAQGYQETKRQLRQPVLESFARLADKADLVLVEGAGAASEVNLRSHDIANMGFAEAANVPVVLIGDIDRGGVIASIVGTNVVLPYTDARRIKGFLINKMRGDARIFADGLRVIADKTGWSALGIVPFLRGLADLPAEDSVALNMLTQKSSNSDIIVLILPHVSNFDDLDPLLAEPELDVRFVRVNTQRAPTRIRAGVVILPGSKSVMQDLDFLRKTGWDRAIRDHVKSGGHVWGLCGGFQMLGRTVRDPEGVESSTPEMAGLGVLDVDTELHSRKVLSQTEGTVLTPSGHDSGQFNGYEIHCGQTQWLSEPRPLSRKADGSLDGAQSYDGRVIGSYIHGIFNSQPARDSFLARIGHRAVRPDWEMVIAATLDAFATHLEQHIDLDAVLALAD